MSFVLIKYGMNEEKLFNPNCLASVFLTHVKRACGYEDMIESVDLATENGEVVDLQSKPREYAKKTLEPRSTYILLKVNDDQIDDSQPAYVPLLDPSLSDKIKLVLSNGKRADLAKGKKHADPTESSTNSGANAPSKGSKNEGPNANTTSTQSSKGTKPSNPKKK